jgi:hypothetical protein
MSKNTFQHLVEKAGDERRQDFIDRHKGFFWSTPEASLHDIGDDLLVEATLNFGTLEDYQELKDILTPQYLAKVFFSATGRKAGNYFPEIRHFFSLALQKYA